MNIPRFSATESLYKSSGQYNHGQPVALRTTIIVPAIPFCGNCDHILDYCALHNGRPRALCNACDVGDCFTGVEIPPQPDPFENRRWRLF